MALVVLTLLSLFSYARFIPRPAKMTGREDTFTQKLDHYNMFDHRVFSQRYFINDAFLETPQSKPDTAIIEIGGEGALYGAPGGTPEYPDVLGTVAMKHHALVMALEHRFYGDSHPFPLSENTYNTSAANLKYLTSRQAIADLVSFIRYMDAKLCADPSSVRPGKMCLRWVVAGGSYPGALTGWITQQHPQIFAAGLSSSGVVNAIYSLPDFDRHTLAVAGSPCGDALLQAYHELEDLIEDNDKKIFDILSIPYTIDPTTSEVKCQADKRDIMYFIADAGVMGFQYGMFDTVCNTLIDAYNVYSPELASVLAQELVQLNSFPTYDSKNLENPIVDTTSAFRQWWSQTCMEVAYFQPAPIINSLRSQRVTLEWHLDLCQRILGKSLGDPTVRTREYYGADNTVAPMTFFSNFWQDIWHICGITDKSLPNVGYIRCKDCGHCKDLHYPTKSDPQELTQLRDSIATFIDAKLSGYHSN